MRTMSTVVAFLVLLIAVRHLDPAGFLFTQGVALCVLLPSIQLILDLRKKQGSAAGSIKDGIFSFLLIYTFLFTFPTQADRSFSLLMIQQIAASPSGLSREEINRFYTHDFIEHGGLDRRLIEQKASGTVIERDGKLELTPRGRVVNGMTRLICRVFNCQFT